MHPGPPSYFSPYMIQNLSNGKKNEYITDRVTKEATNFIQNHVSKTKDKPFFLSLWHFGVHAPYQAPRKLIAKYEAKKIQEVKKNVR